jgi:sugar transferase EpsL
MKRLFDILIAFSAIVCLSAAIIITALFVAIKLGRPVFFSQQRPGKMAPFFGCTSSEL